VKNGSPSGSLPRRESSTTTRPMRGIIPRRDPA
jgi:hypothetical protein